MLRILNRGSIATPPIIHDGTTSTRDLSPISIFKIHIPKTICTKSNQFKAHWKSPISWLISYSTAPRLWATLPCGHNPKKPWHYGWRKKKKTRRNLPETRLNHVDARFDTTLTLRTQGIFPDSRENEAVEEWAKYGTFCWPPIHRIMVCPYRRFN